MRGAVPEVGISCGVLLGLLAVVWFGSSRGVRGRRIARGRNVGRVIRGMREELYVHYT